MHISETTEHRKANRKENNILIKTCIHKIFRSAVGSPMNDRANKHRKGQKTSEKETEEK